MGSSLLNYFSEIDHRALQLPREFQYAHRRKISFDYSYSKPFNESTIFINASGASSVEDSTKNRNLYFQEPVDQVSAHFEYFKEMKIAPTYIYFSSASVYGNRMALSPSKESDNVAPISVYSEGKLSAERELSKISKTYEGRIIILRITSVFSKELRSRIFWRIANQINNNQSITLSGSGNESRDFLHLNELGSAIMHLSGLNQVENFEIFNLGSGSSLSISELLNIALGTYEKQKNSRYQSPVSFSGVVRPWDPEVISVDIGKLLASGFRPSTNPVGKIEDYFKNAII